MMLSATAIAYFDKYPDGGSDPAKTSFNLNTYRVITDIEPGVNFSLARVQAANAIPGGKLKILIDGLPIAEELAFGESSRYKIITRGVHTVSLTDAGGKKLAEKSLTIYPYDNYTIWAWQNKEGQIELLFSAIDMTATTFNYNAMTTATNDGAVFLNLHPYAWSARFLNLSPDLPYATFTNDQSLLIDFQRKTNNYINLPSTAAYNIGSGIIPASDPFLVYALGKSTLGISNPANSGYGSVAVMRVFKSSGVTSELPGQILSQIEPLQVNHSFVANPSLYSEAALKPWAEAGIYTVALIGKTTATAANEKARLIVIKHNQ